MLGSRQYTVIHKLPLWGYLIKDTATCKLSTEEVGHSCQLKYQGSNSYLKKQNFFSLLLAEACSLGPDFHQWSENFHCQ